MSENNFETIISSKDDSHIDNRIGSFYSARAVTNPNLYIGLISPGDNLCNLSNQLILDSLGSSYQLNSPPGCQLNGAPYNVILGIPGLLTTINAVNSDKVLKLELQSGSSNAPMNDCIDTPYGFKLSQVVNNIGDIMMLTPTNPALTGANQIPVSNGWTNMAHLIMKQKAYKITKNGCRYTVFNFTIKNVGKAPAQKVLFKDIIPEGATLLQRSIFVKYTGYVTSRLTSDNYDLFERELFIRLKNIQPDDEVSISLICIKDECDRRRRIVNVGALTYVAYQGFDNAKLSSASSSSTVVVQLISNPKPLSK